MGLRARILAVTQLENGGPRKRNVLEGMARRSSQAGRFDEIFPAMLDAGELVMYGTRRGAVYGPPGLRWRGGSWHAGGGR